jgi:hypothetical protein
MAGYYDDDNLESQATKVLEIAHLIESGELDRRNAKHMIELALASLDQPQDK